MIIFVTNSATIHLITKLGAKPKQQQRASRSPPLSLYAKVAALEAADKENADSAQLHKLSKRGMAH